MSILNLKIKCSRKLWFAATAVSFILLARIKCFVLKGNFSLFDIFWGGLSEPSGMGWPNALSVRAIAGLLFGLVSGVLLLILLAAPFVVIAAGLGWVVAAVVSMIFSIAREILCKKRPGGNTVAMTENVAVRNGKHTLRVGELSGRQPADETVPGETKDANKHPAPIVRMPFRVLAGVVSVACAGLFLLMLLTFVPVCPPVIVYVLLLLVPTAEFGSIAVRGNGLYFLISERLGAKSGKDSARPADENKPQ